MASRQQRAVGGAEVRQSNARSYYAARVIISPSAVGRSNTLEHHTLASSLFASSCWEHVQQSRTPRACMQCERATEKSQVTGSAATASSLASSEGAGGRQRRGCTRFCSAACRRAAPHQAAADAGVCVARPCCRSFSPSLPAQSRAKPTLSLGQHFLVLARRCLPRARA